MKITFAGAVLADPHLYPAADVRINGQLTYEAVQLVDALRQRLYNRGNELLQLTFTAARVFASPREAQLFALTHWPALPKGGVCTVKVGAGLDTEEKQLPGALIVGIPRITMLGVRVTVEYNIIAPGVAGVAAPDFVEGGEAMILRGREPITPNVEAVTVIFSTPFAARPVVTLSVSKPAGGDNVWCTVRDDLVTVDGFTAELSGPVGAGYHLNWNAIG